MNNKIKKMEIEYPAIKGSKNTKKFLDNFSCFNCREIGAIPYILICNHVYCENCVISLKMKNNDGSLICPFCFAETNKKEILPEFDIKLLIRNLNSIDDEEFLQKYENKLKFAGVSTNYNKNLKKIVSYLIKFNSVDYKQKTNNNNNNLKKIYKRTYADLQKENSLKCEKDFHDTTFKFKPLFKYN